MALPSFSTSGISSVGLSGPKDDVGLFALSGTALPRKCALNGMQMRLSARGNGTKRLRSGASKVVSDLAVRGLMIRACKGHPVTHPFVTRMCTGTVGSKRTLLMGTNSFSMGFAPTTPFVSANCCLMNSVFAVGGSGSRASMGN